MVSSDIVEPEVERVKLSLAEENLLEQTRNYVVRFIWIVREIEHIIDNIFKQKFEIAKTRVNKIVEEFKIINTLRSTLTRYATKVSISIAGGSYYLNLLDTIVSLSNSSYRLVLGLELLSLKQIVIEDEVVLSIQNLIKNVEEFLTCLSDVMRYFIENPAKIEEQTSRIFRTINNMNETYRSIYLLLSRDTKSGNDVYIVNFISLLGNFVHDLVSLGEKVVWLYTIRTT